MNRRLELFSIVLFALNAGVVGGITSSRADEAGIEVDVGDLRGEILSLFAPPGAIATETNPNYKALQRPRLRLLPRRPPRTGRATTRR
jgi:alcohol dehydrogenase (cytochrome c)